MKTAGLLQASIIAAAVSGHATAAAQDAAPEIDIMEYVETLEPEVRVDEVDMERLRVRRVDIVDEDGVIRMTLAAPLPSPVVDGVQYVRSVDVNGLMLRDQYGNEVGGYGYIEQGDSGRLMFAFDHMANPGEGLVLGLNQNGGASITIAQQGVAFPAPPELEGKTLPAIPAGHERVGMGINPQTGAPLIYLADAEGRSRIRLTIRDDGRGAIEFLNAEGDVVSELTPEAANAEQ